MGCYSKRSYACLLPWRFRPFDGPPAWGQKRPLEPGRAVVNPPVLQQVPMDLERYLAEGYSIHGPAKLDSVTPQGLVFPGEHEQKGLEISLANKAVVVMDQAGNTGNLRALVPGTAVTVCYRNGPGCHLYRYPPGKEVRSCALVIEEPVIFGPWPL